MLLGDLAVVAFRNDRLQFQEPAQAGHLIEVDTHIFVEIEFADLFHLRQHAIIRFKIRIGLFQIRQRGQGIIADARLVLIRAVVADQKGAGVFLQADFPASFRGVEVDILLIMAKLHLDLADRGQPLRHPLRVSNSVFNLNVLHHVLPWL